MAYTRYILRTWVAIVMLLFSGVCSSTAYASDVSIQQPFRDTLLCKGSAFNVSLDFYTPTYTYYDDTNTFYVELSNASGSFSSPIVIGTGVGSSAPFLQVNIPSSITPGTGYRIRIRTSLPAEISADNGKNIRISQYPLFSLSSNSPFCAGTALSLSSTLLGTFSPVTYQWSGPAAFSSSAQNPALNSVPANGSGNYVLAVNYYGCIAKDSIPVQVVTAPTNMTIRTNSPVCNGEELDILTDCSTCLLPGISCTYSMKLPGGASINNNNLLIKNVTAINAGKYTVTVSVAGCSIKDSVVTDVKTRPDSPWHTSNAPVCLGDTLKLNAGTGQPGVSFLWTGPNGFSASTPNISIPGITYNDSGSYSVVAYLKGCVSPKGIETVQVGTPLTKPSISGRNTVCKGDSILLLATGGNIKQGVFEWSVNNAPGIVGNPLQAQHVLPAHSGFYKVIQKYMGCISPADSMYVLVPEVPKPELVLNNPVCFGEALNMHINDVPNTVYTWKGPALLANMQDASVPHVSFSDSGRYTAIISVDGCTDSTVTRVKVLSLPLLTSVGSNSPVCDKDTLRLSAASNADTTHYSWTGPGNFVSEDKNPKPVADMGSGGVYYVRAVSGICRSLPDSVTVTVMETPEQVIIQANNKLQFGETLYLSSDCPTPGVSYSWAGPENHKTEKQNDTLHNMKPSMSGDYIVTALGTNGCKSTTYTTVTVDAIDVSKYTVYPNPNNGSFTVYGELTKDAYIVYDIFNSLGRSIFRGDITSNKKSFKVYIDLTGAPAGIYYMHMVNSNKHNNESVAISIVR